jgi:hypothetical protein
MGKSSYPRRGERLAPQTLRELLLVPLAPDLAAATRDRYETLADLDESVWRRVTAAVCQRLAAAVASRLQRRLPYLPAKLAKRRLPQVAAGTKFTDLGLDRRALHCVGILGGDAAGLAQLKLGEFAQRRGIGSRTLLGILCALEAHAHKAAAPVPPEPRQRSRKTAG